jgi:hypothetical protein
MNKAAKRFRGNPRPLQIVAKPWDLVALDFVGPLHATARGNRYILVIV